MRKLIGLLLIGAASTANAQAVRYVTTGTVPMYPDGKLTVVARSSGIVELAVTPAYDLRGQFAPSAVRAFVDSARALMAKPITAKADERVEIEGPTLADVFHGPTQLTIRRQREGKSDKAVLVISHPADATLRMALVTTAQASTFFTALLSAASRAEQLEP